MNQETPSQQPEGALIEAAQRASGLSIRLASKKAGLSDARWRQIVKGGMHVQGALVPVVAPPSTLARMAQVIGVTAQQLRDAGRDDAAESLEKLIAAPAEGADHEVVISDTVGLNDQIEMIYASSMTAEQKLNAIGKVLQLHAEVEADVHAELPGLRATGSLVVGSPEDN